MRWDRPYAELAPQPLIERRLLASGAGSQRFQIAAILSIKAARDVDQDVQRLVGGLIAHGQRHVAPDAGVLVARETGCHRNDVETCAPHRPIGSNAQRRIGMGLRRSCSLTALRPKLVQKVDRTAADIGAGILEQRRDAFTAAAPRAFSPSNPIARTLTAGDRSAVIRPSMVAASKAGTFDTKPFGAIR